MDRVQKLLPGVGGDWSSLENGEKEWLKVENWRCWGEGKRRSRSTKVCPRSDQEQRYNLALPQEA
jgi:hypothetical protein